MSPSCGEMELLGATVWRDGKGTPRRNLVYEPIERQYGSSVARAMPRDGQAESSS